MNSGFRLTKVSPAIVLDKACLSQLWPRHVGQCGRAGCEGPGPPVPCAPLASRAPSIAPLKIAGRPTTDDSLLLCSLLLPHSERETGGWPTRSARDRRATSPATTWRPPTPSRLRSEYELWPPACSPSLLSWAGRSGCLGPSHIPGKRHCGWAEAWITSVILLPPAPGGTLARSQDGSQSGYCSMQRTREGPS